MQPRMNRPYYSTRKGERITLDQLKALILALYGMYRDRSYFQEALGYTCVDAGDVPGTMGTEPGAYVAWQLHKNLWPIEERITDYSEEDLFDVIELLYDHVSVPIETDDAYHSWNQCGWHYREFDREVGQIEFRTDINLKLKLYGDGFELTAAGEVQQTGWTGTTRLLQATVPFFDPDNVDGRVESAVALFLARSSTVEDRREAVRRLADVLEYLRPQLGKVITSKDEADLFNIANNFAIRHHNDKQKTDYDLRLWLSWMFYYYLATIHLVIRRLQTVKANPASP